MNHVFFREFVVEFLYPVVQRNQFVGFFHFHDEPVPLKGVFVCSLWLFIIGVITNDGYVIN